MAQREPPTEKVLEMKKQGINDQEIKSKLGLEGYSPTEISEAINQSQIKGSVEDNIGVPKSSRENQANIPVPPPLSNDENLPPQTEVYSQVQNLAPGMQSSMIDEDMPIPAPTPSQPQQIQKNIQEPQMIMPQAQPQMIMPQAQQPMQQLDRDIINRIVESVIDERWQEIVSNIGDISLWKNTVDNDLTAIKQEMIRVDQRFNNVQKAVLGKIDDYNKSVLDINTEMKALEKVFEKIIEPLTENVKELNKITKDLKGRSTISTKSRI